MIDLRKALESLLTPGVKLNHPPNIPLFRASSDHAGKLIRTLNGTEEVGAIVNGTFKVEK
jgi:hypothetical protein